jgi:hypothetical protein
MMDENEREWYFERNREESAYWQKSLALQTEMVEAQKSLNKMCSMYGLVSIGLLASIYFQLGGTLLPKWLNFWH